MKYSNLFASQVTAEIDAADFDLIEIATAGSPGSNKFGFGWTGPEDFARRTHGGPILNGPYLYGYGLSTCIHNGPVTANRPKLFVRTGDVIKVRNLVERGHLREFYFEATVDSRGYVKFEFVGATESKMGNMREFEVTEVELSKQDYSDYLRGQLNAARP